MNMVEVATIGREGMVGIDAALDGTRISRSAVMVQGESDICYRMTARVFRCEMDRHAAFYRFDEPTRPVYLARAAWLRKLAHSNIAKPRHQSGTRPIGPSGVRAGRCG